MRGEWTGIGRVHKKTEEKMMRKDGSTNFAKGESHAQWNFVFLSFLFFSKACQVYYLSMEVASKRDLTPSLPPRSLPPPSKLYI